MQPHEKSIVMQCFFAVRPARFALLPARSAGVNRAPANAGSTKKCQPMGDEDFVVVFVLIKSAVNFLITYLSAAVLRMT